MDYMKPFGCNCQNKVSQDECSRRMDRCNERVSERQQNNCGMERGQRNQCAAERKQLENCMEREQRRNQCAMEREQRNQCAAEREQRNQGCMEREQKRNQCAMQRNQCAAERERCNQGCMEREQKQESCNKNKYENIDPLRDMPLAMAYVPWQTWRNVYDASNGLRKGTIFGELILPFLFASPVCRDGSCGCNNGRRGDMR